MKETIQKEVEAKKHTIECLRDGDASECPICKPINDANANYAMYNADREAKRKAQPSLPAVREKWGVFCSVSGGITGSRQGWLKDKDGNRKIFNSQDEADSEACRLQSNVSPYSVAMFNYCAEPIQ